MIYDKFFYGLQSQDPIKIRTDVFVKEQGFVDEFDVLDAKSWHIVVYEDDRPIATGRAFEEEKGLWHMGRIAVTKEYRSSGIGSHLLKSLEKKLKEEGADRLILFSQYDKEAFYLKNGYKEESSEIVYDEGYPHIKMYKNIGTIE